MGWSDELASSAQATAPASWADELAGSVHPGRVPPTTPQHAAIAARVAADQISQDAQSGPSLLGEIGRQVGNLVGGGVRGAGSIGATLLYPVDKAQDLYYGDRNPTLSGLVTGQQPISRNQERRQTMDSALSSLGADIASPAYKVGKFGAEVAGTAGVGGVLANGARVALPAAMAARPAVAAAIDSLGSGGFGIGSGTGSTAANIGIRAAGGAANGAVSSGIIDPSNAGAGAAIGAVIPVVGSGVAAVARRGKDLAGALLNPSQYAVKNIANQLGDDTPAIADALKSAPNLVPSSVPTAAQAAPSPRMVMMEKALANANSGFKAKLAELENANNAARLQAVANVAKTPEELQAAIAARNEATAPMRERVVTNGNPVPVGGIRGTLSSLENGPLGVNGTIGNAAADMRSDLQGFTNVQAPNTLTNTPGSVTASPAMLDALRQNANKFLSKYEPNGAVGTQEQAAMAPVKSAIIDAIDAANPRKAPGAGGWGQGIEQAGPTAPGYRDYLQEFARRSVPINTMEVGQQLQSKLLSGGLNSAGDAATALPGYRSALAQALRNSDYAIDPEAQKALEAVQADLQRATVSNSIRSPGSDTAYNNGAGQAFLRALGAGKESNFVPAAVGGATTAATGSVNAGVAAGFGAKKASGFLRNRVGNAMGELFLDPQKLAAELQAINQSAAAGGKSGAPRLPLNALVAGLLAQ